MPSHAAPLRSIGMMCYIAVLTQADAKESFSITACRRLCTASDWKSQSTCFAVGSDSSQWVRGAHEMKLAMWHTACSTAENAPMPPIHRWKVMASSKGMM